MGVGISVQRLRLGQTPNACNVIVLFFWLFIYLFFIFLRLIKTQTSRERKEKLMCYLYWLGDFNIIDTQTIINDITNIFS